MKKCDKDGAPCLHEPPYDELLRCLENDWNISASWDGLRKFWNIELTEEGVRLRDAELNNRAERTCRNIAEPDEMHDRPFTCSECGARGPYGEGTYHIGRSHEINGKVVFWDSWPVYKYCPNCGAKVVSE